MRKLCTLAIAGALSWPATSYGQSYPMPYYPYGARPWTAPAMPMPPGAYGAYPAPAMTAPYRYSRPAPVGMAPSGYYESARYSPVQQNLAPPSPVGTPSMVVNPVVHQETIITQPTQESVFPGAPVTQGDVIISQEIGSPTMVTPMTNGDIIGDTSCGDESCAGGQHGILIWAEALWLRPRRNDPLVFETSGTGSSSQIRAHSYDDNFGNVGFRAGGGYVTQDNLIFAGLLTYVDSDVASHTFRNGVFTYAGPGILNDTTGSSLTTRWTMNYQTVDLLAGTVLSPCDYLDLIVSAGARLAWIDQDYRTSITDDLGNSLEKLGIDTDGFGPRVGSEGRIYLLHWLALYGRAYTSMLVARRDETSILVNNSAGETTTAFGRYERHDVIPVVELATGIEASLCDGRLLIGGGYEYNYWFDLASSSLTDSASKRSDLSLDGLYTRIIYLW